MHVSVFTQYKPWPESNFFVYFHDIIFHTFLVFSTLYCRLFLRLQYRRQGEQGAGRGSSPTPHPIAPAVRRISEGWRVLLTTSWRRRLKAATRGALGIAGRIAGPVPTRAPDPPAVAESLSGV